MTEETPRWERRLGQNDCRFLGRAGPIDLWADNTDVPFTFNWGGLRWPWKTYPETVIATCKQEGVHLTLHDECRIHELCQRHKSETPV